ncbi:zinc-binding dehydrogenase [Phlyctema vagabunda]|uniref:Zinc-binding dehydrogenase n=1 Tax=Phlyctema vagabunda TaxID=108571 RepID=A0ABR4P1C5_9HELO
MPENSAAWLTGKAQRLEVRTAPYTAPADNEIVIKNNAIATNPVDYIIGDMGGPGGMMYQWLKFPFVVGVDVAGEVVEVGPGVTRFKIGDRVIGHSAGTEKEYNTTAKSAFQLYTVLQSHMTSPIPSTMSYEDACVLPLCLSTAACGLFQKDQLGLEYPTVTPKSTGKTLLIWGGSTSVGSNAIQLAVAAGYEVFTTASPRNFDYVKKLGASKVFDYKSKTTIQELIRAFEGKTTAGALSIGPGAANACMDILATCKGNKFLSMVTYPNPDPMPTSFVVPKFIFTFMTWSIAQFYKSVTRSIGYKFIWGGTLIDNGLGKYIYEDFLPEALAQGTYLTAPEPIVAGNGLEHVQTALDLLRKGVSAKKVIVTL